MTGIYKIENKINGKVYIGQARDILLRWQEHRDNYLYKRYNYCLYMAFEKYGIENFEFSVIELCSEEELNDKEKHWIQHFHSYLGDKNCNGYNMTTGGEGNATIIRKEVYKLWDQGLAVQQIANITGHNRSAIREVLRSYKNYSMEESHIRGDKFQGQNRQKRVLQYNLRGELLHIFDSRDDAAIATGVDKRNIWMALSGSGLTAGCYQWRYEDDDNIPQDIEQKARIYKRPVCQFDKNDVLVAVYESASDASRITGISDIQIRKVCGGKGMTAGGYKWKYQKEGDV
jgi:group I intron endonuclease